MIEADVISAITMILVPREGWDEKKLGLRLDTSFPEFFVDTGTASVHGPVLSSHDGLDRGLILDVTSKSRDFRDDNNNLVRRGLEICYTQYRQTISAP